MGYTNSDTGDKVIRDKYDRCLEVWEDVKDGLANEKDFIKEREGFFRLVVRAVKSSFDARVLGMKEIRLIKKIKTSRDRDVENKVEKACDQADLMISKGDLKGANNILLEAEDMRKWLDRPYSMVTVHSCKAELGGRESFVEEHEIKQF